jgi:molybdopterin-guanine dinucleotide biosynthesis protein A
MHCVDKALLPLGDRRLVDHVLARLVPQCAVVAVSANGDAARFGGLGAAVLADSLPGHPGPLAGVLAGLDWAAQHGFGQIVTASVDAPFLPRDLVARLWAAAGEKGLALAACQTPQGVRLQPTFGLWPVSLRDDLRHSLRDDGMRKAALWAARHGAGVGGRGIAVFAAAPRDPFFNINTPADLAMARQMLTTDDL